METKANYLLIGAFTLVGFFGLLAFLTWFAGHQGNRQYTYYQVLFPEISGIVAGTQVQFSGVPSGQIVDLRLEEDGQVRVRLELRQETPVRVDSVATLIPQGITGLSIMSISAGSPGRPLLREISEDPEPEILAGRSMLDSISESGPLLVEQLSDAVTRLNAILSPENQAHFNSILGNVDSASGRLDESIDVIAGAVSGIADVATALDAFAGQFDGLAPRLDSAIEAATDAARGIEAAGLAIGKVDYGGLSAEAGGLIADLRAMLGSEDAGALPRNLSETLKAASALLVDLHESGTVDQVNAALQALRGAADDLNRDVSPLLAGIGRAADTVASVASSFRERGPVQTDLQRMIRQIGQAAASVGSMARTIERNPNSLLLGR